MKLQELISLNSIDKKITDLHFIELFSSFKFVICFKLIQNFALNAMSINFYRDLEYEKENKKDYS